MIVGMKRAPQHALAAVALAVGLLGLAGCGTESDSQARDPGTFGSDPLAMPREVPAADGPVSTDGLVTVLDEGAAAGGPRLCLGPVARSLPPQCEGIALADWRWSEHAEHERRAGVRWGDFALTGTFDGTTLHVTEAVPAALYDALPEPPDGPDLETPCDEPEGGWGVVDASKVSGAALDETLRVAAQLDGYAESWLDPAEETDPARGIVNVRVTGDVEDAEATLRETWGGALCVSQAGYSGAELSTVSNELQALPGVLTRSAWNDVVLVEVVHDDGSIQDWADATYGGGRVEVSSALQPS